MEDMMLQRARLMNYQTARKLPVRVPESDAEYEQRLKNEIDARRLYAASYDKEVRGMFQGQKKFQPVANGIDHVMLYNLDGSNIVLATGDISNGKMNFDRLDAMQKNAHAAGMEAEPMESADEIAAEVAVADNMQDDIKSPWLEPELIETTASAVEPVRQAESVPQSTKRRAMPDALATMESPDLDDGLGY